MLTMLTKSPRRAKSPGEKIRVSNGLTSSGINCAIVVPVIRVRTLRIKADWIRGNLMNKENEGSKINNVGKNISLHPKNDKSCEAGNGFMD